MNLYILVEGSETEPIVYRSWISHMCPNLVEVASPIDLNGSHYYMISGYGNPSYLRRIRDALRDIKDNTHVNHFIICVDTEEMTTHNRRAKLSEELHKAETETLVRDSNPNFKTHVIVQNCCFETWLLGNTKMMKQSPTSSELLALKRHYDVRSDDPELMTCPQLKRYRNRADFHYRYLQAMFREQNPRLLYNKANPSAVTERHYLDALVERCTTTDHLCSLSDALTVFNSIYKVIK